MGWVLVLVLSCLGSRAELMMSLSMEYSYTRLWKESCGDSIIPCRLLYGDSTKERQLMCFSSHLVHAKFREVGQKWSV
jgi:hypothetical protein